MENYKRRRVTKKRWGCPQPNKKFRRDPVVQKQVKENAMFCKRSVVIGTINITVGGGWQAFPYQFAINQVPNFSEFAALFDQYRINAVKLTFTPYWDSNDASNQFGATTISLPRVYTSIDKTGYGAGTLATEDQFLEYGTAKQIVRPQEPFSIYVKNPAAEVAAAIGGGFTGNAVNTPSPWLDTVNLNIEHHGAAIGMVVNGAPGTTGWGYHVVGTFYMQFKNMK